MLRWFRRIITKTNFFSRNNKPELDFETIYEILNYKFTNFSYIEQALKHRSILPVLNQKRVDSNERLELLGDAVLGLVVTEFLYRQYPEKEEGELTSMKSLLVSRKILARVANRLNVGKLLFLSDSEIKSGGRTRHSIIADALEAILGALYLDGGLEVARKFVIENVLSDYEKILNAEIYKNFKSILLEYSQSRNLGAPFYIIRSEDGPDHNKLFTVEVRIQNKTVGVGVGNSKKRAEQRSAQDALDKLEL
ncbi:MAG: ribonuclease III [Deferribacteres bacterium]|nr:ribonuclease III [candidate division KSB1 bacterium]MCB9510670.1 ribonuclease III [Deferribacteres bacterium]